MRAARVVGTEFGTASELLGALSNRRNAEAVVGVAVDADPVVDDVDLDRVAGGDRQPALTSAGVAQHVGDSLRDDSIRRQLDRCGEHDPLGRQRGVDVDLALAAASELLDGADETKLLECRRRQIANDAPQVARDRVHVLRQTFDRLA
jgi:hypothetical protein